MSNIPYLEQLSNNEVVTASKAATLAFQVKALADQGAESYPITIDKGGSGQTTQQAAINALTNASAATTGQVLQRNSSGNAVFADGVTYPITIDKGGSGQTTQQASINALTNASAATTNQVLTRNSSGNAVFADMPAPTLPFKSYMAVVTQSGTLDPTVNVGHNSLGGTITWQYFGVGQYLGILSGAFFSTGKTICIINSPSASPDNTARAYYISNTSATGVFIGTKTGGTFTNGLLDSTPIEIRVYN